MAETPHSPPGLPLVGSALDFGDDPLRFVTGVQRAYGGQYPLVRVDPATGPTTNVVLDAGLVHEILGDRDRFRRPNLGPQAQRREGLLSSDGDLWETQRGILQPEFVGERLASYAGTTGDAVEALLAEWPEAGERDLFSEVGTLTLQVIARSLFSYDVSRAESDRVQDALETFGDELAFSPLGVVLPPRLQPGPSTAFERANDALDAFAQDVIDQHVARDDPPRDLLTALLAAERDPSVELSENELVDETVLFLTAGHETTALTITYAFYWLSQHPEVRARVRDEADAVLDGDRPDWGDLPELRTTERVVRETLRLTPAAWNVIRQTRRPVRLDGYRLEAGELLFASPYAHGRDPAAWDDPAQFRPARWREEASRAADAYFPFGSGPRSCIGRQLALIEAQFTLAHVLQHYDVEVLVDDLEFRPAVTLQLEGDVPARLVART
ncbi:MAG: cytochrome P450 [Halobellus sp.]|uniref:cytochrome P450 n=1 Tax=Halobellus sp. TaxID=1979212 RepID=UPI0035D46570